MLLALDLGTKVGYAYDTMGCEFHGMYDLATPRTSGAGMRYLRFRKWLEGLQKPEQVVYEEVKRHAGTQAAHVYGGLQAQVLAYCEENSIPYESIPVGTIKKYWTGKGNAKKDAMIAEGHKRGYTLVKDDNEMDAIAIMNYWKDEGMYDE